VLAETPELTDTGRSSLLPGKNGTAEKREPRQRTRSNGLQLTRVGTWYLASLVVILIAATNTGNNGLFLVSAMSLSALVVIQVLSAMNVDRLAIEVEPPEEIFANRPARLEVDIRHRGRWLPRWLLVVSIESNDVEPAIEASKSRVRPWLLPQLDPDTRAEGAVELMLRRRGVRRIRRVRITSLFPLGLFRKGRTYETDVELLVYPELYSGSTRREQRSGDLGDETAKRQGWSHELYALRDYRPGDDPRGIHWKQTARQGRFIFQQRTSEESRRLRILLDNAVGELEDELERKRFERLVSEAATAAVDYLDEGYEVALITRDHHLPYAGGARQRRNILDALARLEARPQANEALSTAEPRWDFLRLAMDRPITAHPTIDSIPTLDSRRGTA
jgi:uncharacterized protein (DUF58 family)